MGAQTPGLAAARKLPVLFRCPPSRGDYDAPQEPSLTTLKLRRLEMTGGAPARKGTRSGTWATHERMRQAEKRLAEQAQALPRAYCPRLAGGGIQEADEREGDSGARIVKAVKRASRATGRSGSKTPTL